MMLAWTFSYGLRKFIFGRNTAIGFSTRFMRFCSGRGHTLCRLSSSCHVDRWCAARLLLLSVGFSAGTGASAFSSGTSDSADRSETRRSRFGCRSPSVCSLMSTSGTVLVLLRLGCFLR